MSVACCSRTGCSASRAIVGCPQGWIWHPLSDALAGLTGQDVGHACWPRGGTLVSVPAVMTGVRAHSRCQMVIVRHALDAPRSWAESDLEANVETVLTQISARWDIEVLFGDGNEVLGLDHSPLMSASAMLRLWILALLASVTLRGRTAACEHVVATPGDGWRNSTGDPALPPSQRACVAASSLSFKKCKDSGVAWRVVQCSVLTETGAILRVLQRVNDERSTRGSLLGSTVAATLR